MKHKHTNFLYPCYVNIEDFGMFGIYIYFHLSVIEEARNILKSLYEYKILTQKALFTGI